MQTEPAVKTDSTQTDPNPKRKALYDAIKGSGKFKLGDEAWFNEVLDDDARSAKLYTALEGSGLFKLPSAEDWSTKFGKKKDKTPPVVEETPLPDSGDGSEVSGTPSESGNITNLVEDSPIAPEVTAEAPKEDAFTAPFDNANERAGKAMEIANTPLEELLDVQPSDTPEFDLNTPEGIIGKAEKDLEKSIEVDYDAAMTDIEDELVAEVDAGNLTIEEANETFKTRSTEIQNALVLEAEGKADADISDLGIRLDKEREDKALSEGSQVQAESRLTGANTAIPVSEEDLEANRAIVANNEEKRKVFNEMATTALAELPDRRKSYGLVGSAIDYFTGNKGKDKKGFLTSDEEAVEQTKDILGEISTMSSEDAAGFFSGLGEQGTEVIPFVGALAKIPELLRSRKVLNKSEGERTDSEQGLVNAMAMMSTFSRAGLKPTSYEYGEMVGQMIPFIGEFVLTGTSANAVAKAVGTKLLKSGLGRGVLNYTIRGTSAAIAQTALNPQRFINTTIERMTPIERAVIDLDKKQISEIIRDKEGEGLGTAAGKAALTSLSEMLTERLGFAYGAGATRFMKSKVAKHLVNEETLAKYTIKQFAKRKGLTTMSGVQKAMDRMGFNGVISEVWGEELPNMAINEAITGDAGKTLLESLDPVNEDLLKMIVPMLIIQGSMYAPSAALGAAQKTGEFFVNRQEKKDKADFAAAKAAVKGEKKTVKTEPKKKEVKKEETVVTEEAPAKKIRGGAVMTVTRKDGGKVKLKKIDGKWKSQNKNNNWVAVNAKQQEALDAKYNEAVQAKAKTKEDGKEKSKEGGVKTEKTTPEEGKPKKTDKKTNGVTNDKGTTTTSTSAAKEGKGKKGTGKGKETKPTEKAAEMAEKAAEETETDTPVTEESHNGDPATIQTFLSNAIRKGNRMSELLISKKESNPKYFNKNGSVKKGAPAEIHELARQHEENRLKVAGYRADFNNATGVKREGAPSTPVDEAITIQSRVDEISKQIRQLEPALKNLFKGRVDKAHNKGALGKKLRAKSKAMSERITELKAERAELKKQVGNKGRLDIEVNESFPSAVITQTGKPKKQHGVTETDYTFTETDVSGKIKEVDIDGVGKSFFGFTHDGKKTGEHESASDVIRDLKRQQPRRISQVGAPARKTDGNDASDSIDARIQALEDSGKIVRTELASNNGENFREMKIFLVGGDLVTVMITGRGKFVEVQSKSKKRGAKKKKGVSIPTKSVLKSHPDIVKILETPLASLGKKKAEKTETKPAAKKTGKAPAKKTGKKGGKSTGTQDQTTRSFQENTGKTNDGKATETTTNQDLFPKGHPIQVAPIKGTQKYKPRKISRMLASFQGDGTLFGKIKNVLRPNKRRRNSLGNYTPSTGRVATKNIKDIPTITHEVGHSLDDRLDLLGNLAAPETADEKAAAEEIMELSKWGSTPPDGLSAEQAAEYRLGEGIAEFFKSMIFNPQMTQTKFPNASALIWNGKFNEAQRNHFNEFSAEVRAWAGANAHNKIASNVKEIGISTRFERWKKRWLDTPDFYAISADNWGAEAMDAFTSFKPLKATGKLLKPLTVAIHNRLLTGLNRSFNRQWVTSSFAFDKAVSFVSEQTGEKPLPSNNPSILARLLYGMHEKFDDMFDNGLLDAIGNRVKDGLLVMDKNYLISPFDNTSAASIKEGMMGSSTLMIAERIIERFKGAVKTAVEGKINARKLLITERADIESSIISREDTGTYRIGSESRRESLAGTFATRGDAKKAVEKALRENNSDLRENKRSTKEALKVAREKYGDKIVAGVGAGIFRDLDVAIERMAQHRSDKTVSPLTARMHEEGARRYRAYSDALLQYAVSKGRLSQEQYDKVKEFNEYYVAMQRVQESEVDGDISIYKSTSVGGLSSENNPIKKFRGSGKEIENPYASLVENAYKITKEADRNDIMRAFTEMLSTDRSMRDGKLQDFTSIGYEVGGEGRNVIRVYKDGEATYYRFDEDVYSYLNSVAQAGTRLPALLTALPSLLRKTVTTSPPFVVKNRLRDFQARLIISKNSSILERPAETWSKAEYEEIKSMLNKFGGGQAGMLRDPTAYLKYETAYYGVMGQAIEEGSKKGVKYVDPRNWGVVWAKYKSALDRGERSTRLQEFKSTFAAAKKEGLDDYNAGLLAAFEARDLLDFSVAGETMAMLNQILPFSNARVRGLARAARSIKENPDAFAARIAVYSMIPSIAVRLLAFTMGGDTEEEYLQKQSYEKDMFFNFKIGDQWYGIPKPFELGMLGSATERGLTYFLYTEKAEKARAEGNPKAQNYQHEADRAFEGFTKQAAESMLVFDTTSPSSIAGYGAFNEAKSNYIPFRNSSVISPYENSMNIGMRNTESASAAGKLLSNIIEGTTGVQSDPRKVDHIVRSTTSYYGSAVVNLSKKGSDISLTDEEMDWAKTIPNIGKALTGLTKKEPVFGARDVQWVMQQTEAFALKSPQIEKTKELMGLYFNMEDGDTKKAMGRSVRKIATVVRNTITVSDARELKLLDANIEKIKKQIKPDTDFKDLNERFIKE